MAVDLKQRSLQSMDESEGEEATFTCRICFEEDCKPSEVRFNRV